MSKLNIGGLIMEVGLDGERKRVNKDLLKTMEQDFLNINNGNADFAILPTGQLVSTNEKVLQEIKSNDPKAHENLNRIGTKQRAFSDTPSLYDQEANSRTSNLLSNMPYTVTIVGLGGGGEIALHLLRSGIQNFHLIDYDILEKGNLVRHVCGSKFIGQNKAEAVKNLLLEYHPSVQGNVSAYKWDIFAEQDELRNIISSSDVVVVATDTDRSRFLLNEVCVDSQTPAVFVSMFENGCGGEVFTYEPGLACYACLATMQDRRDLFDEYYKSKNISDCSTIRDAKAMPGLGIDQAFLAALAARKALDILVQKQKEATKLIPVGKNWILWSLFGIENVLERHLASTQATFQKHEHCLSCSL